MMTGTPFGHLHQVHEFQSKLAMLVAGVGIIALATWFSIFVHFQPIVLSGNEWAFGPREVAHLLGFMGCVLSVWFFGNSFATRSTLLVCLSMGAIGIGFVVFAIFASQEIKAQFNQNVIHAFLYVLFTYILGCVSGCVIRCQSLWLFQPRRVLILTAILLALSSIGWEVYTQPFEHVYQKPPRGYVQLAQVLCDFAGIAFGYWVVSSVIKRFEVRDGVTDCPNLLGFLKELRTISTVGAIQLKKRLMRSSQTG